MMGWGDILQVFWHGVVNARGEELRITALADIIAIWVIAAEVIGEVAGIGHGDIGFCDMPGFDGDAVAFPIIDAEQVIPAIIDIQAGRSRSFR